jgi:hypothetical protein
MVKLNSTEMNTEVRVQLRIWFRGARIVSQEETEATDLDIL